MRRLLIPLLLAATIAGAAFAGTAGTGAAAGDSYAFGSRDQAPLITLRRDEVPPDFTGGPITAATGETVNVYAQDGILAVDAAANQHWADFLTSLLHGPELGQLTLFIATLDRVQQICGSRALGCYSPSAKSIVALGQDLRTISARAIVTHEYGHHIASNRDNYPWPAVDWGTKRWASYVNVCRRTQAGELAPGDEGEHYELNPGEAFAEDYRLLNERRAGLPETFWGVVSESLYPDQGALDVLAQDVTSPWTGNTTTTYKSVVAPRATGRGFRVATPFDGSVIARLTSPAKAKFSLSVVDLTSGQQLASVTSAARVKTVNLTVCGQRSLQFKVHRVSGAGTITLSVSKP